MSHSSSAATCEYLHCHDQFTWYFICRHADGLLQIERDCVLWVDVALSCYVIHASIFTLDVYLDPRMVECE